MSIALIRYYVREGLMPAGLRTSRNQALYSPMHIQRLRLIRALIEDAGLPIAGVQQVLAVTDQDAHPLAQDAVIKTSPLPPDQHEWAAHLLDATIADAGWQVPSGTPAYAKALEPLVAVRRAGAQTTLDLLGMYSTNADRIGRARFPRSPTPPIRRPWSPRPRSARSCAGSPPSLDLDWPTALVGQDLDGVAAVAVDGRQPRFAVRGDGARGSSKVGLTLT